MLSTFRQKSRNDFLLAKKENKRKSRDNFSYFAKGGF
jgi:hypothetical protein